MSADDIDAVFRFWLRPGERCDDVDEFGRLRHALCWLLNEFIRGHDQPPARIAAVTFHLFFDPAPRRADPPRGIVLRRQRVPRAESDQLSHDLFYVGWGDFADDLFDLWVRL